MALRGYSVTRDRLWPVVASVVLVVVGATVPYLRLHYLDFTVEPVDARLSLFPAATLVRGIDPQWLPSDAIERLPLALNVFNLGVAMHQIGGILAVLVGWALFADEINKFLWWPLHVAGWLLGLAVVPLLGGLHLLRSAGVDVGVTAAWVPLTLAGLVVLVATFRARGRIDTYGGV
jgi:hypothetical protein